MPDLTPNYNLKKPLQNEHYNIDTQNENADIVDAELKKLSENIENVPIPTKEAVGLGNVDNIKQASKEDFDQLASDFSEHQADYTQFRNNVDKIRINGDGKFEYYYEGEWIQVKGDGYPVGAVTGFGATPDNQEVTLTWTDPADVTIEDSLGNQITISKWKGTKVLRKTTGFPQNENDGVTVVDNGVRNQYQSDGFVDTGLTNETTYYYSAFPYSDSDVFDKKTDVEATPTEQRIYGVRVDKNNSNPETRATYIGDAVGLTPMRGNNGNLQWGSWEFILDEFEINPVVLQDKEVNYYLSRENRTKRADGSDAVLTGEDGDVMVEFGTPVWYKWTDEGDAYTIEISNKHFSGAVKHGFEVEDGYNQALYYPLLTTQIFFPILFKSTDSQSALGRGRVDDATGYANTGGTNTKGMFYGSNADEQMCFLGIEDYWGNKLWWIDGLATDASSGLLIGKENFNDNGNGYEAHSSGVSANTAGYIDEVQGGNDKGFIVKSSGGSETTYYADYGNLTSSRVAHFGGDRSTGSYAGFALLRLNRSSSSAAANFGARLFCASAGKIYIGAYLGTTQSGKLRSVSGTSPSDNKTIGAFRTEARANN